MSFAYKFQTAPSDGDIWQHAIRVRRYLQRCGLEEYKQFTITTPSFTDPAPAITVSVNNAAVFLIARVALGNR